MKLIIGLGNPGSEYKDTRHNIGFKVAERIAEENSILLNQTKFRAETGKGVVGGEEVIIARPQTYMNRSGESVSSLLSFFKLTPSDCVVICDDLELPLGRIRLRSGGGHGGHNGLRSIIEQTGSKEFTRVRVGIGRPVNQSGVSDYVLDTFRKDEKPVVEEMVERARQAVETLLSEGISAAMNRFNG